MWNFTLMGGPGLFAAGCLPILLLVLFFVLAQIGLAGLSFSRLGFEPWQGFLFFLACFFTSRVDLPLFRRSRLVLEPGPAREWTGDVEGATVIGRERGLVPQVVALNLGGCVLPGLMCLYLVSGLGLKTWLGLGLLLSVALCYGLARLKPGRGLVLPAWAAPLAGALAALAFAPPWAVAQAAFVCGVSGALLGADVLYLIDRRSADLLDQPVLVIGGRRTFTSIFLAGLLAGLLG
jgi:uncharacterized membrane protein